MSARWGGSCRNVHFFPLMVFTSNLQLSTGKSIFPCLSRVKRLDGDMQGQRAGTEARWPWHLELTDWPPDFKASVTTGELCQIQPWLLFRLGWTGFNFFFFFNYLKSLKNLENFRGKKNLIFWLFLKILTSWNSHCLAMLGWSRDGCSLAGPPLTALSQTTPSPLVTLHPHMSLFGLNHYLPGLSLTDTWKKKQKTLGYLRKTLTL